MLREGTNRNLSSGRVAKDGMIWRTDTVKHRKMCSDLHLASVSH